MGWVWTWIVAMVLLNLDDPWFVWWSFTFGFFIIPYFYICRALARRWGHR